MIHTVYISRGGCSDLEPGSQGSFCPQATRSQQIRADKVQTEVTTISTVSSRYIRGPYKPESDFIKTMGTLCQACSYDTGEVSKSLYLIHKYKAERGEAERLGVPSDIQISKPMPSNKPPLA